MIQEKKDLFLIINHRQESLYTSVLFSIVLDGSVPQSNSWDLVSTCILEDGSAEIFQILLYTHDAGGSMF